MTQGNAIVAFGAINRMGARATGNVAFTLFRLKKELKTIVEFQSEEEQKLIEKYKGAVTENGVIVVQENRDEFFKEREKLRAMECDIEPVDVPMSGIPEITLAEIEALEGFVKFI